MNNNTVNIGAGLSGRGCARVINPDGSVASETAIKTNLILYGGIEDFLSQTTDGYHWIGMFAQCRAGTDSTPNFTTPAGTYSQSGTTVSRDTGSVDFVAGDVGKSIKFSSGEVAYINAFTNASTVEVRESAIVAATTITLWNTQQTALGSQVAITSNEDGSSLGVVNDVVQGFAEINSIMNFSAEVSSVDYEEFGFSRTTSSNLINRLVFADTVTVDIGQQLQVDYTFRWQMANFIVEEPVTPVINGWPYPYDLTSIVHGGSDFTVTTSIDHHYEVGDEITISNAVMPEIALTSITSDSSEFTVITATDHLLTAGDSILISGSDVSDYNAQWSVASVTNSTEFVVTETSNFGTATAVGTVRETPNPYFNNTWEIATIPTASTFTVADATIDSVSTAAVSGDLVGSLAGFGLYKGSTIFRESGSSNQQNGIAELIRASNRFLGGIFVGNPTRNPMPESMSGFSNVASQDLTDIRDTVNHAHGHSFTLAVDEGNSQTIRGFAMRGDIFSWLGLQLVFEQRQRKDVGYTLSFGYQLNLRPELA